MLEAVMLSVMLTTGPAPDQRSLVAASVPFEGAWRITAIDHYDVTFRDADDRDLNAIAESAERAYRRVGASFGHALSLRPLIVVYRTRAELRQAIASRTFPGNREHILWTIEIPAKEADGQFTHELTHVFAFDMVPPSLRRDVPLWLHEGLAEFQRGDWTDADLRFVRAHVDADTLPGLSRVPEDESEQSTRIRTLVGHLAIDFLVQRAGADAPRRLLAALRDSAAPATDVYRATAGLTQADLDGAFDRFVRDRVAR